MAYTGTSIVDFLGSTGQASDFNTRASLAAKNGITGYTGSAAQNTQLLGMLNKPAPAVPSTAGMQGPTLSGAPLSTTPAIPSTGGMQGPTQSGAPVSTTPPMSASNPSPSSIPISTPKPAVPSTPSSGTGLTTSTPMPITPVAPSGTLAPNVTTPTGTTVNPSTGGVVPPPAVPNVSSLDPNSNPLVSNDAVRAAEKAYADAHQLTPEELQNMKDINDLQTSARGAYTSETGQPRDLEFVTGRQRAIQEQETNLQLPLEQKAALLQAKRTAAITASKFTLDNENAKLAALREMQKPVSLPYGGEIVNPVTGATVNGGIFGSSTAKPNINPSTGLQPNAAPVDIMGYLGRNGVDVTRYDGPGLINAVMQGATAQDIVSGRANVAGVKSAATTGQGYAFNTATQDFQQRAPGATPIAPTAFSGGSATPPAGMDVNALQKKLVDAGYMTAAQVATGPGVYGPKTQAAYAAYQKAQGGGGGAFSAPQSSGAIKSPLDGLSAGAYQLATTGEQGSKYGSAQQTGFMNEVRQAIPGFNPQIAKANATAINHQITQRSDVSRAIGAADSNFGLLTDTFGKSGVNDMSSPILNNLANRVKAGTLGDSDVINFTSGVSTLQTEYAMVLGRGGEVTDSVRASAQKVINGDYSMKDLISLHDYIDKEGKNVIGSYDKQIRDLASGNANMNSDKSATGSNATPITAPDGKQVIITD